MQKYVIDHSMSSDEIQDDFIYWSYCVLHGVEKAPPGEHQRNSYYHPIEGCWDPSSWYQNIKDATLYELYTEGFYVLGVLKSTFADFEFALKTRRGIYPKYTYRNISFWGRRQRGNHLIYFRRPAKYVRNESHEKKELSEEAIAKIDWREKKGVKKDKAKREGSKYGRRKTNAKHWSHRSYRSMVKQKMKNEDYDDLPTIPGPLYFDPWDWD